MIRAASAGLLLAVALTIPLAAGEKKAEPKWSREVRDGAHITQENIIILKLKAVLPAQPNTPIRLHPSRSSPPPRR